LRSSLSTGDAVEVLHPCGEADAEALAAFEQERLRLARRVPGDDPVGPHARDDLGRAPAVLHFLEATCEERLLAERPRDADAEDLQPGRIVRPAFEAPRGVSTIEA
jgi:hypothetical protein